MTLKELIPILQVAIGPVILISGVGMLLLTMTNRLGRTVDRSRELVGIRRNGGHDSAQIQAQIDILWLRAQIIRRGIIFAAVAALLAAILVIVLFVGVAFGWEIAPGLILIFMGCLGSLILSLINLIRDINLSLHALQLEMHA